MKTMTLVSMMMITGVEDDNDNDWSVKNDNSVVGDDDFDVDDGDDVGLVLTMMRTMNLVMTKMTLVLPLMMTLFLC